MSKILERRLHLGRIILEKLIEKKEMRWTSLMKATMKHCGTPHTYGTIMEWLLKNEYIERPKRGLYRITDKGKELLKSIS